MKFGGEKTMKNYSIIVTLMIMFSISCLYGTIGCLGSDAEKKPMKEKIKELPSEFRFFSTEVSSKLPYFVRESALWTDKKNIIDKKVEISRYEVKQSLRSTIHWLKKIIKEQWIPEDIEQRLLPLRESLEGNDAIWTRYQVGGYSIQMVVDFGRVRVFISFVDTVSPEDKKAMKKFVAKTVDKFLKKSDAVKKKLPEIQVTQGIASGIPKKGGPRRAPNLWWEQVRWWSDGKTIAFWIPKTDERTAIEQPTRRKHWFSKPLSSKK